MVAFLKIENPGIAPDTSFTLIGASTKRGSDNLIGKFGSGGKQSICDLLRHDLPLTVFGGSLRMDYGVRSQDVNDGLHEHKFNRVIVKYNGTDPYTKKSRTSTEDLGFVLEYGATDWLTVDMALREFVSNAIDRAVEQGELEHLVQWCRKNGYGEIDVASDEIQEAAKFELTEYRKTAADYKNVVIEIVNENQVRAARGGDTTRVFVPLSADVLEFYNNLGKWFLHFSEPELLKQAILPKKNRNLDITHDRAVIYRRGVRVREFESSDVPSLFDYNLEDLELDESRRVDDWRIQHEDARAIAAADKAILVRLWQSFVDGQQRWEHGFNHYGLESKAYETVSQKRWVEAFEQVAGDNAIVATGNAGDMAARKGYKIIQAPQPFAQAAEKYGIRTPAKVLSNDEREGRTIMEPTPDAISAVEFAWAIATRFNLTNGKQMPQVKTFRKVMDGGSQTHGFYRDGVVYINQDIAGFISLQSGWHGLTQQLLVTAVEEVCHHVTQGLDFSRDVQDFALNLVVYLAKEKAGVA